MPTPRAACRFLAGATTILILGGLPIAPAAAQGLRAVALSNNALIRLDTGNPGAADAPVAIVGVNPGEVMVGIDIRPQNGYLYGLGYNSGSGTVQLYAVSYRNGKAAPVGASGTFVAAD